MRRLPVLNSRCCRLVSDQLWIGKRHLLGGALRVSEEAPRETRFLRVLSDDGLVRSPLQTKMWDE
jgi:hypothetical protein